ncbi:hypothetical protein ACFFX0_11865 [Citricoccus parietis]|uniref:Uncharacterized protein n=1 Tax=Citricoccus parietis TaxID=592307 RepID=A0ABV5FYX7_9MICC
MSRKWELSEVFGTGWEQALPHLSSQVIGRRLPRVCPTMGRWRFSMGFPLQVVTVAFTRPSQPGLVNPPSGHRAVTSR